jgi:hypothetical protein
VTKAKKKFVDDFKETYKRYVSADRPSVIMPDEVAVDVVSKVKYASLLRQAKALSKILLTMRISHAGPDASEAEKVLVRFEEWRVRNGE